MMKMVEVLSSYKKLMEKNKEIVILQSAMSIIGWDMETKMPPKGIALRSQQFALLSRTAHKMNTNPEIGTLLN
jgi:carboxypeptidase Taq